MKDYGKDLPPWAKLLGMIGVVVLAAVAGVFFLAPSEPASAARPAAPGWFVAWRASRYERRCTLDLLRSDGAGFDVSASFMNRPGTKFNAWRMEIRFQGSPGNYTCDTSDSTNTANCMIMEFQCER